MNYEYLFFVAVVALLSIFVSTYLRENKTLKLNLVLFVIIFTLIVTVLIVTVLVLTSSPPSSLPSSPPSSLPTIQQSTDEWWRLHGQSVYRNETAYL